MEGNEEDEDEDEESNHMPHIYVLKKHARKATRSQHPKCSLRRPPIDIVTFPMADRILLRKLLSCS